LFFSANTYNLNDILIQFIGNCVLVAMKRYKIIVAKGYTTWCFAVSLEQAIEYAQKRYEHITKDIKVTLDEDSMT